MPITETQVIPTAQRLAILTALVDTGGPFDAPSIAMFQNNINLTPSVLVADLTIATFAGYATTVGMTWGTPYLDVDLSAIVFGEAITQIATSSATPNNIYGYYAGPAGLATLMAAWRFSSFAVLAAAGQGVTFTPALRYSGV